VSQYGSEDVREPWYKRWFGAEAPEVAAALKAPLSPVVTAKTSV